MTAIVFIGPTVPREQAGEVCIAEYLPPVRQGDIYRAVTRFRPRVVGIVDGIFQHVPSVWHSEILWAMAQGVHVFGAASMGALRAAELHPFGMRGVGLIYKAYRNGVLKPYCDEVFEDDDEVAVIHGPAETGYVALSEAMVNIRCTMTSAESVGVINIETRDKMVRIAKGMFYQERSFEALLDHGEAAGLDGFGVARLRDWLPDGQVNQKRDDALAMLVAMRKFLEADPAPARVDFEFAQTTLWENAVASAASERVCGLAYELETVVLDELRLDLTAFLAARRAAQHRRYSLQECERRGIDLRREELKRSISGFRRSKGLRTRSEFDRWRANNDLSDDDFVRIMGDEARLRKLETEESANLDDPILDHLRFSGAYGRLAARAKEKQQALSDLASKDLAGAGPASLRLLVWYFEDKLGIEIPEDLEAYAQEIGFGSKAALLNAVWREYLFHNETMGNRHGEAK